MTLATDLDARPLDPASGETEGAIAVPPGDLFSDEPPWETEFHLRPPILLIQWLEG